MKPQYASEVPEDVGVYRCPLCKKPIYNGQTVIKIQQWEYHPRCAHEVCQHCGTTENVERWVPSGSMCPKCKNDPVLQAKRRANIKAIYKAARNARGIK